MHHITLCENDGSISVPTRSIYYSHSWWFCNKISNSLGCDFLVNILKNVLWVGSIVNTHWVTSCLKISDKKNSIEEIFLTSYRLQIRGSLNERVVQTINRIFFYKIGSIVFGFEFLLLKMKFFSRNCHYKFLFSLICTSYWYPRVYVCTSHFY